MLMAKLINLKTEIVFPCLDLYRIFLCHPDMTTHFKKYEDGKSRVWSMINVLTDKKASDPSRPEGQARPEAWPVDFTSHD